MVAGERLTGDADTGDVRIGVAVGEGVVTTGGSTVIGPVGEAMGGDKTSDGTMLGPTDDPVVPANDGIDVVMLGDPVTPVIDGIDVVLLGNPVILVNDGIDVSMDMLGINVTMDAVGIDVATFVVGLAVGCGDFVDLLSSSSRGT